MAADPPAASPYFQDLVAKTTAEFIKPLIGKYQRFFVTSLDHGVP